MRKEGFQCQIKEIEIHSLVNRVAESFYKGSEITQWSLSWLPRVKKYEDFGFQLVEFKG